MFFPLVFFRLVLFPVIFFSLIFLALIFFLVIFFSRVLSSVLCCIFRVAGCFLLLSLSKPLVKMHQFFFHKWTTKTKRVKNQNKLFFTNRKTAHKLETHSTLKIASIWFSRKEIAAIFLPTATALWSSTRFQQICFRILYGSLGADPSWAARRFHARFHQGFTNILPKFQQGRTKVPPRLFEFRGVFSGSLGQIRFGLGCQQVPS